MQNAVLLSMTGRDWHTKVAHKTEGGSYTGDYWVEFFDDHSLCIQNAFAEGELTTTYNGSYDVLGMTEDGLVLIWNAKEKGKENTLPRCLGSNAAAGADGHLQSGNGFLRCRRGRSNPF